MEIKHLLLIVTLVISSVAAQRERGTPKEKAADGPEEGCPEGGSGFYPHPTQCDAYYECRKGGAKLRYCEDGFVFIAGNPLYERCDHPFTEDCSSRPDLQTARPKGNCPRQNGLFPHPEDCNAFWQCVRGFASEHRCQGPLAFNPKKGICVWPHEVPGCEHVAAEAAKKDDQDSETVKSEHCPRLTGLFPHETDCGKFWQCDQGRAVEKKCRYPLAFSVKRGICLWPQDVKGCEELARESLDFKPVEDDSDDQGGESNVPRTPAPEGPTRAPTRSPARAPPRPVGPAIGQAAPPRSRNSASSTAPTVTSAPVSTTSRLSFRGRTRPGQVTTSAPTTTTSSSTAPQEDYEYYDEA